jgi:hypothetical protein
VEKDFSGLPSFGIVNEIPEVVSRYLAVKVDGVANIESPDYVKQVLASADVASK